MNKINLHISCLSPVAPDALAMVQNDKYQLTFQHSLAASEDNLADFIRHADAVYLGGDDFLSANVLKQAENLKLLSFGGTGYETFIDVKAATDLGIAITNTPGANSQSVAEMAVGLALDALRKISFANGKAHRGPVARELAAVKIGLIGYGRINRIIHKILRDGFGADVRWYNRTNPQTDLGTILRESDMIFIAITANDETRGFIGAEQIAKMKDGVIIINPAREMLIDRHALLVALDSGKIATLAMDGRTEIINDDDFRRFGADRLIVTPHIAARTADAWRRTDLMAFRNIVDFFENGACQNVVNGNITRRG